MRIPKLVTLLFVAAFMTVACGGGVDVDHSKPTGPVEALFAAAKSGDAKPLAGLCDPTGKGDGDTKRLCALTTESEQWSEFVAAFKDGRVDGKVREREDRAWVPIKFGPGATKDEEMRLVKREGKWYLSSY